MDKKSWELMQPLRIPAGWTFLYNKFEDLEPETLPPEDQRWLFTFVQDIFYLYTDKTRKQNKQVEHQRLGIDLGWYPDGDPSGSFRLEAILNDDWINPLLTFSSRSKREIVDTLEYWLFHEFIPMYFIEEDIFRKNHRK
ncbi:MAG: hypothetical protein HFF84_11230 [Oscillibacter sp.]|nr:hypothetical protein [Oscillibacter sp.]